MTLIDFIVSIKEHKMRVPSEEIQSDKILDWIDMYGEFAFAKENLEGHITGSLLIINPEKTKVLLIFHKKLQKWIQFGGHADAEIDMRSVAIREFHEESGIDIEPKMIEGICNIGIHTIPEHKGVPAHKHFDIFYIGMLSEDIPFSRQESEVDDIRWFDLKGIEEYIEPEMCNHLKNIPTWTSIHS